MEFKLDIERLLEELKEEPVEQEESISEWFERRMAEINKPIEVLEVSSRPAFGFGRRCGWCAKYLRAWQFSWCQVCALSSSPPCRLGSRRGAPADSWRFKKTQERIEEWRKR